MELVKWEAFDSLDRLHSRMNELCEDVFGPGRAVPYVHNGNWYPHVDILESKEAYVLRAEVPGMKREDLNVEVEENTLTLSGEKKPEPLSHGVEYQHVERVSGKFSRAFTLPETADRNGIKASYRDGILEIRVPKAEAAKPQRIEITVH
jgi:HSP20 family protein